MTDSKSRFEAWREMQDNSQLRSETAWQTIERAFCDAKAQSAARIAKMREMVNLQCSDGNWNCNSYMHGMANGMVFLLAMMENKEPQYLKAPDVWLDDLPMSRLQPTTCEALTNHTGE